MSLRSASQHSSSLLERHIGTSTGSTVQCVTNSTIAEPSKDHEMSTSSNTIVWPSREMEGKNAANDKQNYIWLEFKDFVDLQTRLVLIPRVAEEGRGAIISAYHPPQNEDASSATANDDDEEEKKEAESDSSVQSPLSSQSVAEASRERTHKDDAQVDNVKDIEGCIFLGLESKQDNWKEREFTSILAALREDDQTPLTLVFEVPTMTNEPEGSISETQQSAESTNGPAPAPAETKKSASANTTQQDALQSGMLALSAWGMRMRAQATEAANSLSTVAKEHTKHFQTPTKEANVARSSPEPCGVFLQTSVGAFVPVAKAQSKVTTSSLLLIRKSATEAVPVSGSSGWSFQWYRSAERKECVADDAASVSTAGSVASSQEPSTSPSTPDEFTDWILLEGATHTAFQPNATLIGRRLRCIVLMPDRQSSPSSDDSSDDGAEMSSIEMLEVVCEVPGVVWADSTLFNGARNAIVRGANFGGLKGRGNAQGRQFRIEVSIGMVSKKRSRRSTSSIQIYQVSGQESIPLTANPILQGTAQSPDSNPKHIDLAITVPPESVLSALFTDGYLQLETPNRLARESLLITLGIANYPGKPANLNASTVLYPDTQQRLPGMQSLVDDDVSVSSASCASSVHSIANGLKPIASAPPSTPPPGTPPTKGLFISPIQSVTTCTPSRSLPGTPGSPLLAPSSECDEEDRFALLEREVEFLRGKLTRKDKVISELQRQITKSDASHQTTQQALSVRDQELKHSKDEVLLVRQALQKAEQFAKTYETKVQRLESEHSQKVTSMESQIQQQSTRIAELEKANRALQNEKAVIQAAVEARESKLTKMGDLQRSFDELSGKVAQYDKLRSELESSNRRYEEIQQDLRKVERMEKECRTELESTKDAIERLTSQVAREQEKAKSAELLVAPLQRKIQQLKGERNSFKQKNESLSKEIARLCKNGRSIRDIEKTLSEHQTLQEEVETLRKQKRKALEDAHTYRTSYEQSKVAHELAGVESETRLALERNAELERLLAEMTEYVNAKEMQLETMKQVNEHFQREIHSLAQANLSKNEI